MKRLFFLIIAGFLSSALSAQVWRISGGESTLYLGGSVHLLREEDYPLPAVFETAFARADRLVLEADIEQLAAPDLAPVILSRMILPDGQTLKTILSKRVYRQLEKQFGDLALPLDRFLRFKPAVAANMLGIIQIQGLGFSLQGPDTYFFTRAKETAKPMGFLETVDVQIDLLTSMGSGYEDEFVRYALGDWSRGGKHLQNIVNEWKTGRSETLEREMTVLREKYPRVYRTVFAGRNDSWIPLLEQYLATAEVEFVIVGAGHLYGPGGLLEQLRSRGWRAEPFGP